jgi:hypothetical protein
LRTRFLGKGVFEMKGDYVIVRAYGDEPLVRRVWDVTDTAVYVCGDERYTSLIEGTTDLVPIGFPKSHVYVWNPEILQQGKSNKLWDLLKPYG